MKGIQKFLSGLVLGGLVGAAAALLLTPASGNDLRNQIEARVERVQMEVKQASEQRRAELEQQLASLRTPRKPESA